MSEMQYFAEDEGLRFEAAEDTEGQPKEEEVAKNWDHSCWSHLYLL